MSSPSTPSGNPQLILNPDRDPAVPPWSFALTGAAPDPANGDPLPTDPGLVDVQDLGTSFVFTMPAGSVLEPGQTYTITLRMMLRPGLTPNDFVHEHRDHRRRGAARRLRAELRPRDGPVRRHGDRAASRRARAQHDQARPGRQRPRDCPTSPMSAATRPATRAPAQRPPTTSTAIPACRSLFRATPRPWRFRITNAGTLPISRLVSIDNLPTPGDQGLIVVIPRGSQWQPTYDGGLSLISDATTPPGAVFSTFYSTVVHAVHRRPQSGRHPMRARCVAATRRRRRPRTGAQHQGADRLPRHREVPARRLGGRGVPHPDDADARVGG